MANGRQDPSTSLNFNVIIPGLSNPIGFRKVTGLSDKTNTITYREGGDTRFMRKLPGLSDIGDVTLMRGESNDTQIIEWRRQIAYYNRDAQLPDDARRDVRIQSLGGGGGVLREWKLINCLPMELSWDDLDAENDKILIQSLVLVSEGIEYTNA